MKKWVALICLLFVIIVLIIAINFKNADKQRLEVAKFNLTYEEYNTSNLNGLDIITIINKAVNNNEKYNISKNEEDIYIPDENNSIKIYVIFITEDLEKKEFGMEIINSLGMHPFIENFGEVKFDCTDIQYHGKTGRVSELTFKAIM